jgi:cob(I)alamin adenosyltransferase
MPVYTKTGDKLTTSVIGARTNKASYRIDSYGTSDEALAYIGSLYSQLDDKYSHIKVELEFVMKLMFNMGADLANPFPKENMPFMIKEQDSITIENYIDEMEKQLPDLKSFVYPIGCESACKANEIRALIRRTERKIALLKENLNNDEEFNNDILALINRLSDYFFVLYRYFNMKENVAEKIVVF